jgi:hypothetical protein
MLTLFSSLLYAWQVIVLSLLMSVWRNDAVRQKAVNVFSSPDVGFYFVTAIGIALSLPPMGFLSLLFMFHTYLQWRNMTTYEYLIEQSKKKREKAKLKNTTEISSKNNASSPKKPDQTATPADPKPASPPEQPAQSESNGDAKHHDSSPTGHEITTEQPVSTV